METCGEGVFGDVLREYFAVGKKQDAAVVIIQEEGEELQGWLVVGESRA